MLPAQLYLDTRLKKIGLANPPTITQQISQFNPDDVITKPLFEATMEGVRINYYRPNGATVEIKHNEKKWGDAFWRMRYLPEIEKQKGRKYDQPPGSGLEPWLPPHLIEKCRQKQKIERLVIVEGEFKALALENAGVDCLAITGIHAFSDSESKNEHGKNTILHPTITDVVTRCQVQHLILLFDADAQQLHFDEAKATSKNWMERPRSFYSAVYKFALMCQPLLMATPEKPTPIKSIRFKCPKLIWAEMAKGIDDLLEALPAEKNAIANECLLLQGEKKYLDAINVTDCPTDRETKLTLKAFFGVQNPIAFVDKYAKELNNSPIRIDRAIWRPSDFGAEMISHDDGDNFMRVGSKWFKLIKIQDQFGQTDYQIRPYDFTEINRDYGKIPFFIQNIKRYDAFTNLPDFTRNYKRNVGGLYNLANPLPHLPVEGQFPHISQFLAHIWGGEAEQLQPGHIADITGSLLTVFVDWLTLALRKPEQKLVVPVLVSEQNNTGKTTLLELVSYMFGTANSAILGNERFKTNFNGHYISKYIICIDEGFLASDKRSEKEALKQLVTSSKQYVEFKGANVEPIPFFGKILMTSNDENRVMSIEETEDRWLVQKVKTIAKEDPHLKEKMRAEVPHFLHFLFNRQVHHPHKTRFWFDAHLYRTNQFFKIVKSTRPMLEQNIDELVRDLFVLIKPEDQILHYDTRFFMDALKNVSRYPVDATQVRTYLAEKRKCPKEANRYWQMPVDTSANASDDYVLRPRLIGKAENPELVYQKRNCSPYVFHASEWLDEADYASLYARNLPTQDLPPTLNEHGTPF